MRYGRSAGSRTRGCGGRSGSRTGCGGGAEEQAAPAASRTASRRRAATARQPWRRTSGSVGRRSDRGDGMLVDEDFLAFALEHHGETVETLQPPQEMAARHKLEIHRLPFLQALEEIPILNID